MSADTENEALRDEVERLRSGGRELGRIVDWQCKAVLDATGMDDWTDIDGDGDWAVIWEALAELRPRAERAEAERDALRTGMKSLADKWEAWTPGSIPPPSGIAAAYERGIRACTEDLRAVLGQTEATNGGAS